MKIDAIQLACILSYIAKAADVDTADSIAAHIAALEQERDEAQREQRRLAAENERFTALIMTTGQERDAANARLEMEIQQTKAVADALSDAASEMSALRRERDAAVADNAALMSLVQEGMYFIRTTHLDMGGNHRYSVNNGPVAAKAIGTLLALKAEDHPGAAMLEEHRKALVRARNEGRVQGIREALEVVKEEGHVNLMPCIADLLDDGADE